MKHLILFSTLLFWITAAYLTSRWKGTKAMGLSLHAASARNAYIFFAIAAISSGVAFFAFMLDWFIPTFKLDLGFQTLLIITLLCILLSALIPDISGFQRMLHRFAAWSFAVLLLVLNMYITLYAHLKSLSFIFGIITIICMFIFLFLFLFVKTTRKHFLLYQVAYIVTFQLFILAVTYL